MREDVSNSSGANVNEITNFENVVNQVKTSQNLSSRGGGRREKKMAYVLKLGTGLDGQDHVSTPVSLKSKNAI